MKLILTVLFMILAYTLSACESCPACEEADVLQADTVSGDLQTKDSAQEIAEEVADPAEPYPAGPYGVAVGDIMKNELLWDPTKQKAVAMRDFYIEDWKAIVFVSGAGSCYYCKQAATGLNAVWEKYHDQGVQVVYTLFKDGQGVKPPSDQFVLSWKANYKNEYPVLTDMSQVMWWYAPKNNTPLLLVVDGRSMEILFAENGDAVAKVEEFLKGVLGE